MESHKRNNSFFWATVFFRELYACGVEHLVISPGSRSTPLVLAAASHPGFKKHVVLDERSAAFIALGIGKASAKPAALICTSGTAVANYYPAVIEARQSGVPFLALSADRPPHLRNTGASQAIDQIKLFGDYPVFFHEAGEPVLEEEDIKRLKRAALQAVSATQNRKGPAHINFPFRKPLDPEPNFVDQIARENQDLSRKPSVEIHEKIEQEYQLHDDLLRECSKTERPLIVAGPLSPSVDGSPVIDLAEQLNAPVISETGLNGCANTMQGFGGFLRNAETRKLLEPDLILRFGSFPASKGLRLALREWERGCHIHFAETDDWSDESLSVTHRINWNGRPVSGDGIPRKTGNQWMNKWVSTKITFFAFREKHMHEVQELTDGHVFYELSKRIPDNWNIFLSNSFPVRDMHMFGTLNRQSVFVNRGAGGIDGVLSTAIGVTLASQKPGILFIGDLAALHDSNAFLSNQLLHQPLVVVLLNNRGGNIFRMLPVFENKTFYTDYFETPQQADFSKLAEMHRVRYQSISTPEQLQALKPDELATSPGIHLIECQTDPDASMKLRNALWNFSL